MTAEEIGTNIAERLLQGAMNHQQFANYYNFLGLQGYKLCHEYHYFEQNYGYRSFITYFIQQYDKLVPSFSLNSFISPSVIPDNWYGFKRNEIDTNVRKNGIKNGLEKYIQWETETKRFLEDMSVQALNINEIGLVYKIKCYIQDVEKEIANAKKEYLLIKATNFDLSTIASEQEWLIKKYTKKLKRFKRKEFEYDQPERN